MRMLPTGRIAWFIHFNWQTRQSILANCVFLLLSDACIYIYTAVVTKGQAIWGKISAHKVNKVTVATDCVTLNLSCIVIYYQSADRRESFAVRDRLYKATYVHQGRIFSIIIRSWIMQSQKRKKKWKNPLYFGSMTPMERVTRRRRRTRKTFCRRFRPFFWKKKENTWNRTSAVLSYI